MKNTEKYIKTFDNNLTNKQLNIVKNTIAYQRCKLADLIEELKSEGIIQELKRIFSWRKNR